MNHTHIFYWFGVRVLGISHCRPYQYSVRLLNVHPPFRLKACWTLNRVFVAKLFGAFSCALRIGSRERLSHTPIRKTSV